MDKFSSKHFLFLILGTSVVSLKTYPGVFIKNGGRESWVAIIISSILIAFFFLYAVKAMRLVPSNHLVKIYQTAMGKFMGNILIVLFAITIFLTMIECASLQADTMHQNMMVETPNWYFLILFIIPSIYMVRKDIAAVVIITIIAITLIMFAGINLSILTIKYKHVSMLFPIFNKGVTKGFIISILESLGLYGFISINLPFLYKISDRKVSIYKYVIIALIILIQMHIVSITGIIMTFSLQNAESFYYPKLVQTHLVSYFQFLEFGELYVMLQTIGGWLIKYLISFHALLQIFSFYNMRKHHIYISSFVLSGVVFVAAFFATRTSIRLFHILNIFPWICLANFIVIPCAVFFVYSIKIKKQEQNRPLVNEI